MNRLIIIISSIMFFSVIGSANSEKSSIYIEQSETTDYGAKDDYLYMGIQFIYRRTYSTDSEWFSDTTTSQDETGGLGAILGYNYNNYIAIEGRVNRSLIKEDYADILNYSIFIKPQYKFIDRDRDSNEDGYLSIYALLGYGLVKVTGTDGKHPGYDGEIITDDNGFQWGVGLSYTFDDRDSDDEEHNRDGDIAIFIEYNRFMTDRDIYARLYKYDPVYYEELSQDAISAGVTYRY
jgi:hypothetical protein